MYPHLHAHMLDRRSRTRHRTGEVLATATLHLQVQFGLSVHTIEISRHAGSSKEKNHDVQYLFWSIDSRCNLDSL